ncbi:MAG: hypothetical protein M3319_02715 [Actinomycetota bacterium]|nr:hypothetical protein [Actinomycetota bacterium]MDQ3899396.1 hypothetical protein [Actinomycetota bacterium]
MGAVLAEVFGLVAVLRFAVIVLLLAVPLTCTALQTRELLRGNARASCAELRLGVMVTVSTVPLLGFTVQVEPFSAVIVPRTPSKS